MEGGRRWTETTGGTGSGRGRMVKSYGPFLSQIFVQVTYGAMYLITRLALTHGMSHYTFVVYRQIVAALTICPLAYFLERGRRLNLKLRNVGQIFLLALLAITIGQNFYYAGLAYTSTTLTSTMTNLNPAITLLMAYLLRLEEINVKSLRGLAKIFGTLLCVGGALTMTLVKGAAGLTRSSTEEPQPFHLFQFAGNLNDLEHSVGKWLLGAILLAIGVSSWCAFLIYQAWVVEEYPSQLALSTLVCLMGAFQCTVVGLLLENPAAFIINWDLQLIAVAYSGIFCSGLGLFATMWCVKEKGPVYTSAFNPLSTVLVAVLEPILLQVHLQWESLLGMAMVIGGLYCVLWGKSPYEKAERTNKEEKSINRDAAESIVSEPNNTEPLLITSSEQIDM